MNKKKIMLTILSLITFFILPSCYTVKQGAAMLGYLNRAVPLESLLKSVDTDPTETEKNRRFVELVQDIRRFATEELGLNLSKNYTRYVKIDRDYLAAVVSASAADSFKRHEWKYPVVGSLPYKGFFNAGDARKERKKLEKKELDVWVRGVEAFSTLGWFKDPLYSYMRDYPPHRLADLIIHETLHATVFIRGQAQFNEELAEFIGSEGSRLYIESRFGADSEEYNAMIAAAENSKHYVTFIQELCAELQALYDNSANQEETIREKERIISSEKERFEKEYESRFTNDNYRGFSTLPVNNAYLELYRLYYAEDDYISKLYAKSGKSLPEFIAVAKTMLKKAPKGGDAREMLAKAVSG